MKTNANIKCSYNNDLLTLITMFKSVIIIKEKLRGMDRYVLEQNDKINLLINIIILIVNADKLKLLLI